jgi:opacity protein-like surface antigen
VARITSIVRVPVALAIAVVSALVVAAPASAASSLGSNGYDISWPQCGGPFPDNPAFAIVGVSSGLAFHDNPCLAEEFAWAAGAPSEPAFYFNTANPGAQSSHWTDPGPKPCAGDSDDLGCAYNYGYNAAGHAFAYAMAQTGGAAGHGWWLDVETSNTWSANPDVNVANVEGMLDYLGAQPGVSTGIYSTKRQWNQITGGASFPLVPNWVAGAGDADEARDLCDPASSFTGGAVELVQYPAGPYNADHACLTDEVA